MSRIGRLPVAIPAGVTVDIKEGNDVVVKGPKGTTCAHPQYGGWREPGLQQGA